MPDADFWNARYAAPGWVYGEAPNAFVAAHADRIEAGAAVVEVGAGEGRNAAFLSHRGYTVTAVDASAEGLAKIARLPGGDAVETVVADVTTWAPGRVWDAAVTTFLHLAPADRPALYRCLQQSVRPGGLVLAEWYRPEQRARGWHGGPPDAAWMPTRAELDDAFPETGIAMLEEADVDLDEGPGHQGPGAVVRLIWKRPESS